MSSKVITSCADIPHELIEQIPSLAIFSSQKPQKLLFAHSSIYNASKTFREVLKNWKNAFGNGQNNYCFDGLYLGKNTMKHDILMMRYEQLNSKEEAYTLWHTGTIQAKEGALKKINPILPVNNINTIVEDFVTTLFFSETLQSEEVSLKLAQILNSENGISVFPISKSKHNIKLAISWNEKTSESNNIYSVHYIPKLIVIKFNYDTNKATISNEVSAIGLLNSLTELRDAQQ